MEVPSNVIESVNCLLRPYGLSYRAIESAREVRYITARQASMYCGLSSKTLREMAFDKEIASIKLSRHERSRVLIDKASLDEWLESCKHNLGRGE